MSPGRHGERVPVPFAASRCRAKPCIGSDLRWSEPELIPTGLRTVWLTIQSAFVRARKRRACATLPGTSRSVVHARRKIARARSLDLLRDAPSRAPRLRSSYLTPARDLSIARRGQKDAFGRTLQPTLSKTSTRARRGCRSAGEHEARTERRALCSNGSKARFGRLVLARRASVLGSLTRAFRADR